MRLKGAKQVHYDSGPNMTPLVDVVMVILIFLMLAGSFGGAEHYLVSGVPVTQTGAGGNSDKKDFDEPVEIRVDSPVPDRFIARVGDQNISDQDTLNAKMMQLRQKLEAAGTKRERAQIVISPGRNVKFKHLIAVFEAAIRPDKDADGNKLADEGAAFTKVSFATSH